MKKIYILGSLFFLLTQNAISQNTESDNIDSKSLTQTTIENEEEEKSQFVLSELIDELENSFEIELVSVDDLFNITLTTNQAINAYSINLKDNTGKTIIDGNIEPNTTMNFDLTDYPAENYLLRVTDMSTLKMTVYKILPL